MSCDIERLFALLLLFEKRQFSSVYSLDMGIEGLMARLGSEIDRLISERDDFISRNIEALNDSGIRMLTYWDDSYPESLKNISDPPLVLFYKGQISLLAIKKKIGIVGSRRATSYGLTMARRMARAVVEAGAVTVSGGAFGIDNAVHKNSCIEDEYRSIVVMGCGLSDFYPRSYAAFFEKFLKNGGLILSEFLPLIPPAKHTFPRRNRLISGLSDVVVVIEAAKRSGALITAGYAVEQGKDVYALPGRVDSPASEGTNRLIYDGAIPIFDLDSFLEEIGLSAKERDRMPLDVDLNPVDNVLLSIVQREGNLTLEDLIALSGLDYSEVLNRISQLEIKGLIQRMGGIICLA